MDIKTFNRMADTIAQAHKRFPRCTIANCDCNSLEGQWASGCICLCHFDKMKELYPGEDWTLAKFMEQARLPDPTQVQ